MNTVAVRVEVTQEDIDHGEARDCSKCPVALALSRAIGQSVEVMGNVCYIGTRSFPLPGYVDDWIWKFDDLQPSSPFSFDVDLGRQLIACVPRT